MSSQIPLPFALRPNRSAHPGTVDMPRARRTKQQVQAERLAKDKEKLKQAQSRKKTIQKTAQVEADIRQTHEEKRRHAHNPPPVEIKRVLRSRPLSDTGDLGHVEPDHTQEDASEEVPNGDGEGEGDKDQGLEEGDDNTIGAGDDGACEDETHDQVLDPSDDEQPKKCKQASKRGALREQIQYVVDCAVDPLPAVEQGNRKRKVPMEEQHPQNNKKQKNRVKGGLSKDWEERLATLAQPLLDDGPIGANISNEFSRSSSARSAPNVLASCHSKPTWVDSDDALGGLSEHEGDTEGDDNERSAIDAIGASTRPAYYHVGTVKKQQARTLQRSYAQIIPTTSVATFVSPSPVLDLPRGRDKIQLGHLPRHLVSRFNAIFCPHLRAIFGKTTPWEMPAEEDIKHAWATVFPKECALDFGTPLGIVIQKLIIDRLVSWRHNIGHAGLLALQTKVFPNLPAGGVANSPTPQVQREWCTWAISRTEGDHPLYFADFTEDADGRIENQSGIFQSKIISAILGHHINTIVPLRIDMKTDRPIGALVLAIQSAKRAVTFYTTGVICKPPRPAADFSKANWGDHTKYDADGHPVSVYPTSTLINLIEQLKPKQWEKILSAATEESKANLNAENSPFASTTPNTSTSEN